MTRPVLSPVPGAIVVGTSAGGVDALSIVLPALPVRSGVPVFVVLHQPRQRRSLVVDIFGPRCAVPVREAEDKDPVVPGTVYFAPPDYHLLVDRGGRGIQLALSTDAPVHFSRPSVDVLFESAADIYGSRLLGIILTGANSDGAAGLAAVEKAGGRIWIQDPATAHVPLMPGAALETCPGAEVKTLDGMAELLATMGGEVGDD